MAVSKREKGNDRDSQASHFQWTAWGLSARTVAVAFTDAAADDPPSKAAIEANTQVGPGHLYYIGILLTGLFITPFSPLARVIVLSWLAGEFAWWFGMPLGLVNLFQHLAAFVIGSRYLRNEWCIAAWVMFLPMLTCDALSLIREQEVFAWWALLCTALAQLVLLPLGMDFSEARWGFLGKSGQSGAGSRNFFRFRLFSG